ncbi:MAG: hypothetical protein HYZ49_03705 [Chloroflexi bacterium]|nr:hypothetical protein [Chloroflexota bacterium]
MKPFLALAVVAVLAAGVWGLFSPRLASDSGAATSIGEFARVPGGLVRVDGVTPEHMADMNMQGFAATGMSMSAMGMDTAPEGYRRFSLDVTLVGQGKDGLRFSPAQFRVAGEGIEDAFPIRAELGDGWVPSGNVLNGSLLYQVPESASRLQLVVESGARPALILLELPPAEPHNDHTGAEAGSTP